MNFNNIAKGKINKIDFDNCLRDKNYTEVSKYFYKIAMIIANIYRINDQHYREDLIQDSVYTAYKRKSGFDFNKNSSAYSYFYKLTSLDN